MSVLIKDMEMPKSCDSCDLLQDYDGDWYCPLNSYLNFGDINNVPDYVMDSCPLSEVPEQKKGKWKPYTYVASDDWYQDKETRYRCSKCSVEVINKSNFCPNCGSPMVVK